VLLSGREQRVASQTVGRAGRDVNSSEGSNVVYPADCNDPDPEVQGRIAEGSRTNHHDGDDGGVQQLLFEGFG
jgi:hypothetical protein